MKKLLILPVFIFLGCGKDVDKDFPPITPPVNHVIINKTLVPNGNVSDKFVTTNDSKKVVYIADEDSDGINELYSADVDATNRRKISGPLDLGENVVSFKVSPNSEKVAYIADHTTGRFNLYTVDLDGTNLVQVNVGVPSNSHSVGHYLWTPNSAKIVYTCDENAAVGNFGLFIVNPNATGRITLNPGPVVGVFDVAPNGARVVYRQGLVNPILKSITPAGIDDIQLNSPFNLGARPASVITSFVIAPNSNSVAYVSNQDNNSISELFVTDINGLGTKYKVSGSMTIGGNVSGVAKANFDFTPDSQQVVYMADQQTNNIEELFISNVDGTGNLKISGSLVSGGNVSNFKTLANKTLFLSDKQINNVNELYMVDNDGTNLLKINSNLVAGENVSQYETNGTKIAYLMDIDNSGVYSVYSNDLDGGNEIELSSVSSGIGAYDIASPFAQQLMIKNNQVLFRAALNSTNYQLYSININGGALTTVSHESLGGSVILAGSSLGSSFIVTPSGVRAVYRMTLSGQNNLLSSLVNP
jgi:hypothetical protein